VNIDILSCICLVIVGSIVVVASIEALSDE